LPSGACFIVYCPSSFVICLSQLYLQFCFFVRCFSGFCQLSFVYFVNNLVSALFVFCLFVSYLLSLCQISFVSLSVIFCLCVSYLLSLCHLILSICQLFWVFFTLYSVFLSVIFCLFISHLLYLCQLSFVFLSFCLLSNISMSILFCLFVISLFVISLLYRFCFSHMSSWIFVTFCFMSLVLYPFTLYFL